MFSLIQQVFIVLLSFSESLACDRTRCLFLNDELCVVKPTLIELNPVEVKYYPLIISLYKCTEVVISYLLKYVFQKTQKT